MDRLAGIVRCQWRAYWRRFSRGTHLTVGNQGISLVIAVLILIKYSRLLGSATVELASANTTTLRSLLAGIFLAWLFLPIGFSRPIISSHELLHLPLSVKELFAIRTVSLLMMPYSLMLGAASLAICYSLAVAPQPLAAIAAALLFIAMSCSTGLALAQLLNMAVWRRLLLAVLVLGSAVVSYVLSGKPARHSQLSWGLPTDLVCRAAIGESPTLAIGLLVALNCLALALAWWSFRQSLVRQHKARSSRRISVLFALPGAAGGLAAKDFRYFRKLLDPYFGLAPVAMCCVYLVSSDTPSASVAWMFIVIVFIPNAVLAFNSFGFDRRSGFDRYALLPASGATIMCAKSLAFVILVSVQVCPILLLVSWRLGLSIGVLGLIEAASLAAAYLSWGNWMSVTFPTRMQFFRFAPSSGALPEIIAGLVFGSLPGLLLVYVWRTAAGHAIWAVPLILFACVALYFFTAIWSGKRFEQRREKIAHSVS